MDIVFFFCCFLRLVLKIEEDSVGKSIEGFILNILGIREIKSSIIIVVKMKLIKVVMSYKLWVIKYNVFIRNIRIRMFYESFSYFKGILRDVYLMS